MHRLVSVIIPTFNRERYLGDAIDSVLSQTHEALDVIVVDDGSTDNTREFVARYAPAVRYAWQENAERGAARNHGLRLARGEFVAFLDADDMWAPDKLELDLALLSRRTEVGFVYSDIEIVDADGHSLCRVRRRGHEGWVTAHLLVNNFVSVGAHLARTDAMRGIGGFREERDLAGSEDWEAWVRLSTHVPFGYLPRCTTRVRVHAENSMSNAAGMERSMRSARCLMEAAEYLTPPLRQALPRTRSTVALACAINYCCAGHRRRTWSCLVEATRHQPSVLLDPRFAYTLLRSLCGPRAIAEARRRLRGLVTSGQLE